MDGRRSRDSNNMRRQQRCTWIPIYNFSVLYAHRMIIWCAVDNCVGNVFHPPHVRTKWFSVRSWAELTTSVIVCIPIGFAKRRYHWVRLSSDCVDDSSMRVRSTCQTNQYPSQSSSRTLVCPFEFSILYFARGPRVVDRPSIYHHIHFDLRDTRSVRHTDAMHYFGRDVLNHVRLWLVICPKYVSMVINFRN